MNLSYNNIRNNNIIPDCFGILEIVFPKTDDGLRHTPEDCMKCEHKTQCLRKAMTEGIQAIKAQEEFIDKAYDSGTLGFWSRWSRKKNLHKQIQTCK